MRVRRSRSQAMDLDLAPAEVAVLAAAARDLLELLTGDAPDGGADPLEALVGLSPSATRPDDPALLRLLPDAYRPEAFEGEGGGEDAAAAADAASAEFRRFTDADLRAGKRAHADTVLETLAAHAEGGRVRLDRDQADAWVGFLNDVRLVLGVRLEVDEDTLDEPLDDDDPRADALRVYAWLGYAQELLLENLEPRRAP